MSAAASSEHLAPLLRTQRMSAVAELFKKLTVSDAAEIVKVVKTDGLSAMPAVAAELKTAIENAAAPDAREAALVAFGLLVAEFGAKAEPYLFPLVPALLEAAADKSAGVRTQATSAATALFAILNPYSTESALPALFDGMNQAKNWQTKVLALNLLADMAKTAPIQVASCLHEIVPRLTGGSSACVPTCCTRLKLPAERMICSCLASPPQTAWPTPRSRSRPRPRRPSSAPLPSTATGTS